MSNATGYTVVWGYCSNPSMLSRELFTTRVEAWKRVQELFAVRHDIRNAGQNPVYTLAVLEVYHDLGGARDLTEISKFTYMPNTKYAKWDGWSCYKATYSPYC